MPLVWVRYKFETIFGFRTLERSLKLKKLCQEILPREVSRTLHIEEIDEAHLTPEDIEVWTNQTNPYLDVQKVDVAIIVDANEYDARDAKKYWAAKEIADQAHQTLGEGVSGSVWIKPAYEEFGLPEETPRTA